MTSDELHKNALRGDIQRILWSPDQIERWLAAMDFLVSVEPTQRLFAADLLAEAAVQMAATPFGPRLLEAAAAMRSGKPTGEKAICFGGHGKQLPLKPLPIKDLTPQHLNRVEVSEDEFSRLMQKRDAWQDPDAKGCEKNRGGIIYWLTSDGRVAGDVACEYDGRGEYFPPAFFVYEPWSDSEVG